MILNRDKKRRDVVRTINAARAEAIGPLTKGCEIFGLTKGQFSLVEILEHCLDYTGPAHLAISTWTAGGGDVQHLDWLVQNQKVLSCQWLLDASFPSRKWEYCELLAQRFGEDNLRFSSVHLKCILLKNADWNLCIRTGMNLNKCLRLEHFEISDDLELMRFLLALFKSVRAEAATFGKAVHRPKQAHKTIAKIDGAIEPSSATVYYGEDDRIKSRVRYGALNGHL